MGMLYCITCSDEVKSCRGGNYVLGSILGLRDFKALWLPSQIYLVNPDREQDFLNDMNAFYDWFDSQLIKEQKEQPVS